MSVPVAWVHNQRAAANRRRPRCVRCGHGRTIPTELGPLCRAHAVEAPPQLSVPRSTVISDGRSAIADHGQADDHDLVRDGEFANVHHDHDQDHDDVRPA